MVLNDKLNYCRFQKTEQVEQHTAVHYGACSESEEGHAALEPAMCLCGILALLWPMEMD